MVVGDHQFRRRTQHAAALDTADGSDRKRDVLARNESSGGGENPLHAGARIRCTTNDLNRLAVADVDHAHAQPVSIGMLFRRDHRSDHERLEQICLVLDVLDLKPDHGEPVHDLGKRGVSVEMLPQPGQGEFHAAVSGDQK